MQPAQTPWHGLITLQPPVVLEQWPWGRDEDAYKVRQPGPKSYHCARVGVISPISMAVLKDLSRRIRQRSGEVKAHQYLLQRLSVAVQRGNAISVLSSVGELSGPDISACNIFFCLCFV